MAIFWEIDNSILNFINSGCASEWIDPIMLGLSDRGTWLGVAALALGSAVAMRRKDLIYCLAVVFIAATLSDVACYELLKPAFARLRPCYHFELTVRMAIEGCGSQFGFPSNHAANGMSVAVVGALLLGKRYGIVMLGLAFMVGLSRVYLGLHFPSDVLAGFLFGGIIGLGATLIGRWILYLLARHGSNWSITHR